MGSEKTFENRVKQFLKDEGCWILKTWGNGVQRSGIPDLLICHHGMFIGVELKAANGKPSELQLYNLRKIDECGGLAILLFPDDFQFFKRFVLNIKKSKVIEASIDYEYFKGVWKKYEVVRN